MTHPFHRARRAFLRVGLLAPLVLLGLAAVVTIVWLPQLPDPIATHWSGAAPDGFAPRWTAIVPPLIGVVLVALNAGLVLFAHRAPAVLSGGGEIVNDETGRPQWSVTARFLGATGLGLGVMLATVSVAAVGVQRGLADAADAPGIGWWSLAALVSGVLAAVAGWFLQPRVMTPNPRTYPISETVIARGEKLAWFGEVSMARGGTIAVGFALAVVAGSAAATFALDPRAGAIVVATLALLVLALACTMVFRVRVNAQGLRVRSLIGWPNTVIPLDEIEKVELTDIHPFAEFGGWGWRIGLDGRRGVVMRKGEALQVTHGGRVFVVTVDGAAEAAAVLEALRAAASTQP